MPLFLVLFNQRAMHCYQSRVFVDSVINEAISQRNSGLNLDCFLNCTLPLFFLQKHTELFFLLSIDPNFQEIPTQEVIWHDFLDSQGVSQRLGDKSTAHFLFVLLSPVEQLNHPVKGLSLDEIEGNVLAMSFYDSWGVEEVDIVESFCIHSHDLESFGLLVEQVDARQCPLNFVGLGKHLLDEEIILLHCFFLNSLAL